jgi:hypothetical protein
MDRLVLCHIDHIAVSHLALDPPTLCILLDQQPALDIDHRYICGDDDDCTHKHNQSIRDLQQRQYVDRCLLSPPLYKLSPTILYICFAWRKSHKQPYNYLFDCSSSGSSSHALTYCEQTFPFYTLSLCLPPCITTATTPPAIRSGSLGSILASS